MSLNFVGAHYIIQVKDKNNHNNTDTITSQKTLSIIDFKGKSGSCIVVIALRVHGVGLGSLLIDD